MIDFHRRIAKDPSISTLDNPQAEIVKVTVLLNAQMVRPPKLAHGQNTDSHGQNTDTHDDIS
jgi:hypothetical protein